MDYTNTAAMEVFCRNRQKQILEALQHIDPQAHLRIDPWERTGGGGGNTCVLTQGKLLAKGGVNYACVHGAASEMLMAFFKHRSTNSTNSASSASSAHSQAYFRATGLSIVLHPVNPYVPIIHMNVRQLAYTPALDHSPWQAWLGGGIDLTPHYIDETQAQQFHQALKALCDAHNPRYYPDFSQAANAYFHLKHRGEARGIGGIFFDQLPAQAAPLAFVQDLAKHFMHLYEPLTAAKNKKYGKQEIAFQNLRRGRYVEFNLVHDKGTLFGFQSQGRMESILMSLPPLAEWAYNPVFEPNSPEAHTMRLLQETPTWLA